eukprot:COSAG04_NODE_1801_length_5550_cov_4.388369_8_plen_109_part_00
MSARVEDITRFFVVCLCADELLIGAAQLPFLDILERTATNSTGETEDFWATAPPPPPPPPPPPAPVGDGTLRFFRLFEEVERLLAFFLRMDIPVDSLAQKIVGSFFFI